MANVKTAISLGDTLFEKVEALSREMKVSRSRLFVMALEDFIHRHQNQQLLERINAAYSDAPDQDEQERLNAVRRHHRRMAESTW